MLFPFALGENRTSGPKGQKNDSDYAGDKSPAYPRLVQGEVIARRSQVKQRASLPDITRKLVPIQTAPTNKKGKPNGLPFLSQRGLLLGLRSDDQAANLAIRPRGNNLLRHQICF